MTHPSNPNTLNRQADLFKFKINLVYKVKFQGRQSYKDPVSKQNKKTTTKNPNNQKNKNKQTKTPGIALQVLKTKLREICYISTEKQQCHGYVISLIVRQGNIFVLRLETQNSTKFKRTSQVTREFSLSG